MQLFTYCIRGNARYGYIITDQELVVIRVRAESRKDSDAESDRQFDVDLEEFQDLKESLPMYDETPAERARVSGILEYKAISWQNHKDSSQEGSKAMTVNLALWWLHMMAAEGWNIEETYTPLGDAVCNTSTRVQNHSPTFSNLSNTRRRQIGQKSDGGRTQQGLETDRPPKKRRWNDGDNDLTEQGVGSSERPARRMRSTQ